ncbi:enoyl-CoA hydratase/isomerase family protein [Halomonas huangheensis]|uniref:3-hydroxyisobutyryl-CoA hydrolase n=1 Tax=Halomonas huangheensis TaxID=1178482 RepID=W1NCM6_9GAMM|nr:enoyl-CoA hydratase/isomerase family protein [Halomonas huangheensis]ALM52770.1 enoyl-CoA hydratase [Halomonas huangheensis]ERL52690.1 hypothetical protein BJB45_15535 [Halomonas huangheensis]
MTDELVRFDRLTTQDGGCIAVATLNSPRTLNSLSLEMARQLDTQLQQWAEDPSVHLVWLDGDGDKAFCAGGDVVALVRALKDEQQGAGQPGDFAREYFSMEYRLDYRLHTFPKPVVVWADGIVMGGGLGLMAGSRHRVVTETSRIAMPEITIGLYPDIGASWFLNRLPSGIGAYLGLTGANLNARDVLDLGLADRFVPRANRQALLERLTQSDIVPGTVDDAEAAVVAALAEFEDRSRAPAGQVDEWRDHLQSLAQQATVSAAVTAILADDTDNSWLAANRARLEAGCPLSAHLAWQMLARHRHTSLADAFREELVVSVQCCVLGDFAEGVRALLIDKDKSPRWRHAEVASVSEADLAAMFGVPWGTQAGPLDDL